MKRTTCSWVLLLCFLPFPSAFLCALNTDNRYFPFIPYVRTTVPGCPSYLSSNIFFTTAHAATARTQESIGISNLHGTFDLGYMGDTLTTVGKVNPMPFDLLGRSFLYIIAGPLTAEGVNLFYRQAIWQRGNETVLIGAHTYFMHTHSIQEFVLDNKSVHLSAEEIADLDVVRQTMFAELGLATGYAHQVGLGDTESYLRYEREWYYCYKFRQIIFGAQAGVIWPTGQRRNLDNAASVPFGGDGHYGVYAQMDAEFELKEDLKAGIFAVVSKRLARVQRRRLPIAYEAVVVDEKGECTNVPIIGPEPFGALTGEVRTAPGPTLLASAYISAEKIRGGLGGRAQYTIAHHCTDSLSCLHKKDVLKPTSLTQMRAVSPWSSEYVSLTAFYDLSVHHSLPPYAPIIQLKWDIPVVFFGAQDVVKNHVISFGFELEF